MKYAIIFAALFAANAAAQDAALSADELANVPSEMDVAAAALAATIDDRERPEREIERCAKVRKKAERKAVWATIALAAVSGAGNAYASQRTATFNYRGSDGYRATSSVQYTDSYDLARRNRESAKATAGVMPSLIAGEMKKAGCQ